MHLTDSQWTDIMKLVIDNMEREINITKMDGLLQLKFMVQP